MVFFIYIKMQTLREDGTIYIEQLPLAMQNSAFYIKKKLCNFSQIIIIIIIIPWEKTGIIYFKNKKREKWKYVIYIYIYNF